MSPTSYGSAGVGARIATVAAAGVLFVMYFVVLHALIVSRRFVPLTLLLIIVPWFTALASAIARRALDTMAACAVALALVGGGAWRFRDDLAGHVDTLLFVENLVFLLAMGALFARTLVGDREALVTGFARIARNGDMPPQVVRYSRRLTAAWAAFFVAAAAVSTFLFATQSHALWSSFVNLALWPLMLLFFVVEYAVRLRCFPHQRATPFASGFRAFAKRDAGSDAGPPR